MAFTAITFT